MQAPVAEFDPELVEQARKVFAGPIAFLKSAPALQFLPDPAVPEVAFAGRSNVGKSSLLNALTNRNSLARTSVTPGRTQELNFFDVGDPLLFRLDPADEPQFFERTASASWIQEVFSGLSIVQLFF